MSSRLAPGVFPICRFMIYSHGVNTLRIPRISNFKMQNVILAFIIELLKSRKWQQPTDCGFHLDEGLTVLLNQATY